MDEMEQIRRDIEALHQRLNALEQTATAPAPAVQPSAMPESLTEQIVAFRAELARIAQVADQYAALEGRVQALELRRVN